MPPRWRGAYTELDFRGVANIGFDASLSARTSLTFGYDFRNGQRDEAQSMTARLVVAL